MRMSFTRARNSHILNFYDRLPPQTFMFRYENVDGEMYGATNATKNVIKDKGDPSAKDIISALRNGSVQ